MPRPTSEVTWCRASRIPPPGRADRQRARRRPKRRGGRVSARVQGALRSHCRRPDVPRWRPVPAARPTLAEGRVLPTPLAPSPRRRRRRGSGFRRRTQRASGQPLANAPRWRCASPTASRTRGTPAASARAVTSTSRSVRSTRVRPEELHHGRSEAAAAAASAERRSTAASLEATRRARSSRSSSTPAPVLAETTSTGNSSSPSSVSRRAVSRRNAAISSEARRSA